MTKEQIMIDGVDVLKCGYYSHFEGEIENACYAHPQTFIGGDEILGYECCHTIPNCYYKQLQRKTEECERLSSLIRETQTYSDVCCECRDEILIYPSISGRTNYTQVEVEERSLKKIIQQLDQLKAENEHLAEKEEEARHYLKEAYKYKQALQEIKKIIRKLAPEKTTCNRCLTFGFPLEHELLKLILQKCEVLDE